MAVAAVLVPVAGCPTEVGRLAFRVSGVTESHNFFASNLIPHPVQSLVR